MFVILLQVESLLYFFSLKKLQELNYLETKKSFFQYNFAFDEDSDAISEQLLQEYEHSKNIFYFIKPSYFLAHTLYKPLYTSYLNFFANFPNNFLYFNFLNLNHFYTAVRERRSIIDIIHAFDYYDTSISSYFANLNKLSSKDLESKLFSTHHLSNFTTTQKRYELFRNINKVTYTGQHQIILRFFRNIESFSFLNSSRNTILQKFLSFHHNSFRVNDSSFNSFYYFYALLKYNNRLSYLYSSKHTILLKNSRTLNPKVLINFTTIDREKIILERKFKHKFKRSLNTLLRSSKSSSNGLLPTLDPKDRFFTTLDYNKKRNKHLLSYISDNFWQYHFLRYRSFINSFKSLNNGFFFFKELSSSFWDSFLSSSHKGNLYFFFNYKAALTSFNFFKKTRNIKKNRFKVLKYRNMKNNLIP